MLQPTKPFKYFPFEEVAFNKTLPRLEKNRTILEDRLNLDPDDLKNSNINYKVNSLLQIFHGNIEWYQRRIKKERFWLRAYNVSTILLIILIPVSILLITEILSQSRLINVNTIQFYSSLFIAFLTSLFGLHRVITSWIGKRKLLSVFHEASSRLKARFYQFEDVWNSKRPIFKYGSSEVKEEFDSTVENVITVGRKIANDERSKYFQFIENPGIDLGNIFTNAFKDATSVFNNFQSRRLGKNLEELKEHSELEKEIAVLEKESDLLNQWLQEVNNLLATKPQNPDVVASLTAKKKTIEGKIDAVREVLTKKKAR